MIANAWEGDWPVSQHFGARYDYYWKNFGLPGHEGVDIAIPQGIRVRAQESGEVVEVGLAPTHPYGHYVKIRTPDGADWLWAHLLPYDLPRPGTWLGSGAPHGWTGASGNIQGVHLHLGYRPRFWDRSHHDGWRDPLPLL